MALLPELINNYVFQNKFKSYFHDDLSKALDPISKTRGTRKDFRTVSYNVKGIFNGKERILNFPNFFSYVYSLNELYKNPLHDFGKLASPNNKMKVDFTKRRFQSNSYTNFLDEKLDLLISEYDKMYKIDIQSFYKSIYTHVFEYLDDSTLSQIDKNIGISNNFKTNGLLLGNLFSTFAANEIMDFLSRKLSSLLPNTKNFYFSDQFYIFYNEEYSDEEIMGTVEQLLSKDYFEFKVNVEDSQVYNHETLLKERQFKKKMDELFSLQHIERGNEAYFVQCDYSESTEKMLHFFNLFNEYFYDIDMRKRESFTEVTIKKVFSSSINLFRLKQILNDSNLETESKRIIELLFLFLKNIPSLIVTYVTFGIFDVVINSNNYKRLSADIYINYFKKKMIHNISTIDSVYYFHIYFLLTDKFSSSILKRDFLLQYNTSLKGKNYLLDAIISQTFSIVPARNEIMAMNFKGEEWLSNYSSFINSYYYLRKTDCFSLMLDDCKKKKVAIVKSLYDIDVEEQRKINLRKVEFQYSRKLSKLS